MIKKTIQVITALMLVLNIWLVQGQAQGIMEDKGKIIITKYIGMTLHAYLSPVDAGGNVAYIVETPNRLVIIDTGFKKPYTTEFSNYAKSLGKKIDRVIISHEHRDHWYGLENFAGEKIYSTKGVIDSIATNGQRIIDKGQKQFGDQAPQKLVIPDHQLDNGEEVIDGVKFIYNIYKDTEADSQVVIRLPQQNLMIAQDAIFTENHQFVDKTTYKNWISVLNELKNLDQYTEIVVGHQGLANRYKVTKSVFAADIQYLEYLAKLLNSTKTLSEFKQRVLEKYPKYTNANFLDFHEDYFPTKPIKPTEYALTSTAELKLNDIVAMPVTYKDRPALQVKLAPGVQGGDKNTIAWLDGIDFHNGVIEVDLAGKLLPDAPADARAFIGLAFRVNNDASSFESIYLRPVNARVDNQVRRNHSTQYFSFPDYSFDRFRKEAPEKYESYVDLVTGEWTKMRIVVNEDKALLFVNNSEQPVLIVNDLKLGASRRGAVGLWVDIGTEGYFANLKVTQID